MSCRYQHLPRGGRRQEVCFDRRIVGGLPFDTVPRKFNNDTVGLKRRILIDCGEGFPEFAPILRECLARERCAVETILLTHHHWDHIGGLDQVLDALRDQERAPRGACPLGHGSPCPIVLLGLTVKKTNVFPGDAVFKVPHDETDVRIPETFPRVEPLRHGDVFEVPGATLETILTPGHTSDSCSFWLREEHCLFVGDCVLGRGSSVFTDLSSYEASLHRLAACAFTTSLFLSYQRPIVVAAQCVFILIGGELPRRAAAAVLRARSCCRRGRGSGRRSQETAGIHCASPGTHVTGVERAARRGEWGRVGGGHCQSSVQRHRCP